MYATSTTTDPRDGAGVVFGVDEYDERSAEGDGEILQRASRDP